MYHFSSVALMGVTGRSYSLSKTHHTTTKPLMSHVNTQFSTIISFLVDHNHHEVTQKSKGK